MTKISKSYSIDLSLVDKIEKLCYEKSISPSSLVNSLFGEWIKDQEILKITILKCDKCGAEYSSKMLECPNCLDQGGNE